jgi:hypothetical protein
MESSLLGMGVIVVDSGVDVTAIVVASSSEFNLRAITSALVVAGTAVVEGAVVEEGSSSTSSETTWLGRSVWVGQS